MEEIHAGVRLGSPASLAADSTAEFTLEYANQNHDGVHHLQTVTLAPTWDLSQEETFEVDAEIPPRTRRQVVKTSFETPLALGGRQGLDVEFTVEAVGEAGESLRANRHAVKPLTVPVRGACHFEAVVCTAGDEEMPTAVRNLIQNWGFDSYVAADVERARDRFTEFADSPTLFVGVLPASGADEAGRQFVSSAAWAASKRTELSVVFAADGVTVPDLPPECSVFTADLTDQRALMAASGQALLAVRHAMETGQTSSLIKWLEKLEDEPKELLRSLAFAVLFAETGVVQTIDDAIEVPEQLKAGAQAMTMGSNKAWPMRGANPANTGSHHEPRGPTNESVSARWTVEIGGPTYSSPAVADGTVYGGSRDPSVYAIDAATGRTLWTVDAGNRVESSPAVVDATVYVLCDSSVYAIDSMTGRTDWSVDMKDKGYWSPAVVDGTVYTRSSSTVYAIDAATGQTRWTVDTGGGLTSSPAVADGTVYVTDTSGSLSAIDAATGQTRWTVDPENEFLPHITSLVVADGTVYFETKSGRTHAKDAATGRTIWTVETGSRGELDSSPAVADGTVYVGNRYNIFAIDAGSGETHWTFETGDGEYSSPVVADGTVYVGSGYGSVYAIDARSGETHWTFDTGSAVYSSPTVADGTVYVRSSSTVYALTE